MLFQARPATATTPRRAAPLRARRARCRAAAPAPGGSSAEKGEFSARTRMRAEALSPFRTFRKFIWFGLGASATIGTGIASIQTLAAAAHAPAAQLPLADAAQSLGIDVAGLITMIWLYRREEKSERASMVRIGREEVLGRLKLELASGKVVRVAALQETGTCRPVIVAGQRADVEATVAEGEAARADLEDKGVLMVPLVVDEQGEADTQLDGGDAKADLRWRATPVAAAEWAAWLAAQRESVGLSPTAAVWLSLRADGRIRASGKGMAPWARLAAELPPIDAGSFLAGFDGSVDALK